jgi:hypothetical protein
MFGFRLKLQANSPSRLTGVRLRLQSDGNIWEEIPLFFGGEFINFWRISCGKSTLHCEARIGLQTVDSINRTQK